MDCIYSCPQKSAGKKKIHTGYLPHWGGGHKSHDMQAPFILRPFSRIAQFSAQNGPMRAFGGKTFQLQELDFRFLGLNLDWPNSGSTPEVRCQLHQNRGKTSSPTGPWFHIDTPIMKSITLSSCKLRTEAVRVPQENLASQPLKLPQKTSVSAANTKNGLQKQQRICCWAAHQSQPCFTPGMDLSFSGPCSSPHSCRFQ